MKKALALFLVLALALTAVSAGFAQDDLSGELEIFSWWAGDEGPALEALITLFNEQNPNVEVINATVTGGSGVNARAVLKTRMLGGDAPDSFQVHAGEELTGTWVVAGRMADLTTLYQEQGWMEAFPRRLARLVDLRRWHLQCSREHSPLQRDVVQPCYRRITRHCCSRYHG